MKTDRLFRYSGSAITVPLFLFCLCACLLLCACAGGGGGTETDGDIPAAVLDAVNPRDLTVGIGARLPAAADYFSELSEGCTAELLTPYSELTSAGAHEIRLRVTSPSGKTREMTATLTLVTDNTPPMLSGVTDISVQIGDAVAYRKGITVSDDCFGEVTLTVDSSAVDVSREGSYPVVYTATDAVGNSVTQTAYVHVYEHLFSEEELWRLVDEVIAARIRDSMTTEQKCRVIYDYVQLNIAYSGTSDKTDWKKEAYNALTKGSGDCFSYFAVSKAFFERLGIENLDVERSPEVAAAVGEQHYWSMVNIAEEGEAPRWYHFDGCRLNREYAHSGCLLTDKQLDAYNRLRHNSAGVNNYFYAYDRASYPATSDEIITPTPALEPYD